MLLAYKRQYILITISFPLSDKIHNLSLTQNDFEEVCRKLSRGPLIWIQRKVFEEKNIFFIFFLHSTIRGETFWKF